MEESKISIDVAYLAGISHIEFLSVFCCSVFLHILCFKLLYHIALQSVHSAASCLRANAGR